MKKQKILIFGAGVIGSLFGGCMAKAGHQVTLFARNNRLKELQQNGLLLKKTGKRIPEKIDVHLISELSNELVFDYVFVTLQNEQVNNALPQLTKISTQNFVFMVNNPSGYSDWIDVLGKDKIVPAFPGAGGKIEKGVVEYQIVSGFIQPTTIGELTGNITPRIKELKMILAESGFNVSVSKNMDSWQKTHVAMIAPLAVAIYLDGGNNYTVARNKKVIHQMNLALKENFQFLKNSEIGIEPPKLNIIQILPIWFLNIIMKYLFNSKWAETVICNHALKAKSEMYAVSRDFIKMAEQKGFTLKELNRMMQ